MKKIITLFCFVVSMNTAFAQTHRWPVLMLLALVCLAALLAPLHHKLEKWATVKLMKKNK